MYWRGQYSPVNIVPPLNFRGTEPQLRRQLSEGFVRFLSWGTSFTGGGGGDNIH